MFPWWAASLTANAAIICVEYVNRVATGGWVSVLPQTLPLIVVAQFCLFLSFNGAPSWLWGWAFFSLGNSVMRLTAVYFVSTETTANWGLVIAGIIAMFVGALVLKQGVGT